MPSFGLILTSPAVRGACGLVALLALGAGAAAPRGQQADPTVEPKASVSERVLNAGLPRPDPEALRRWPEGPVRYLLSGREVRLYRSLKTDRERRAFIKQFWLRRDPNIDSLENEFRFAFWQRVAEANNLFTRTTTPGWLTDRGRFYITLGPPNELESTAMPNQRSGEAVVAPSATGSGFQGRKMGGDDVFETFRGLERWTYYAPPESHLPPHFVLAFRLNSSGEYEWSTDTRDWSHFDGMLSETVNPLELGAVTDPVPDAPVFQLYQDVAVAMDLGIISRVPDPDELLSELVTSEEFFGLIPFLLQVDYYKTAGPTTLAVFTIGLDQRTLGVETDHLPDGLLVVGRIASVENPMRQVLLSGDSALQPSPDNDSMNLILYQGVQALRPGAYNATFGILDRQENRVGSYRERIRVPAFPGEGLSLSTLSLARRLTPLDEEPVDPARDAAGPFRLGNYQIVPKTERGYTVGDEFALYYQVYGAAPHPDAGHPLLDLTYRFFVLEAGDFVPIGRPIRYSGRTRSVQGWSFPIMNWPTATFRLEVTVEDRISGEVAVGQTIFSVQAADGAL